jgi:uncharacterized protein YndB with AHSA1/START domain
MTETKMAETAKHVFEIYIKTTPERLWRALTDGGETQKYFFGSRVESDWQPGSQYQYLGATNHPGEDDTPMLGGEIIEADAPRKLSMTFRPLYDRDGALDYPTSRVTWEITPTGETCKLTLVHDELTAGHPLTQEFFSGWSTILSSLKTYLETGEALKIEMGK